MTLLKLLCIALLLGFAGCSGNDSKPVPPTQKQTEITNIHLTDLNGEAVNLEKYKDKTVFINFWATWCKPCIAEMPSIESAQRKLSGQDIVFLLASDESMEQVKEFSDGRGYKLNFVRIDNFEEQNIQALPTTFIFNPAGRLIFSEMGSRNWDDPGNINLITNITKQHD
ncbi:MAG: TlpA family protein disulfide reductase [Sediminibacterium sp.]|nr:TlpA family protein disulfide reductase [Sediminibacterium sp.]